jgi:cathepsin L
MTFARLATAAFCLVGLLFSSGSFASVDALQPLTDGQYVSLFQGFKSTHARSYSSTLEEQERFAVFRANVDKIRHHNSEAHSWRMDLNEYADLSPAEFKERMTCLHADRPRPHLSSPARLNLSNVPDAVDWVAAGAVTPVKNQLSCGSCWAFSTTGSVEGAWFKAKNQLVSLSEQQLVDCSSAEGNAGCNGGLMDKAFKFIEANGICTETSYPYKAADGTCQKCTSAVKITSFADVLPNNEDALQAAVAGQPVSIALCASGQDFQFYSSGVYSNTNCCTNLDHGVLVVGYGALGGVDYWKVKNSWGESWGDQGYILLKRGTGSGNPGICGLAMEPSYPVVGQVSADSYNVPFTSCASTATARRLLSGDLTGQALGSVTSISANAWPPVAGDTLEITLDGTVSQTINNGTYSLKAAWDGISIWSASGSLTDFGIKFPLQKNFQATYSKQLPSAIPEGTITLTISASADVGSEIFCVKVSASM